MILYELVNPSDPYTFYAPDAEVAEGVAVLLGNGKCAAKDLSDDAKPSVGMYLFSCSPDDIAHVEDILTRRKTEIIDALKTLVIGSSVKRELYEGTLADLPPDKQEGFKERWHDLHRTSYSDYGAFAKTLIDAHEKHLAAKSPETPLP